MTSQARVVRGFDRELIRKAAADAFRKLSPRLQFRNPVMFVVFVCCVLTTLLWAQALAGHGEALAEGRGKAQAAALRSTRKDVIAKKLSRPARTAAVTFVPSAELRSGDCVLTEAGDTIPGDGEVIEGAASVDESAITGESAPVIRESGGDRSAVTGGTRVLSDWLVVRITRNPGESFLDRMIAMVEGAS